MAKSRSGKDDMMANRWTQDQQRLRSEMKKVDTKEFELPETLFISDIDTKVIQGIISECLSKIDGIALAEGNFIDNILGRSGPEISSGIHSQQDSSTHSVSVKIALNIRYGISIPQKAEEIQNKVVEELTRLTGLHVSAINLNFKSVISEHLPMISPRDMATKDQVNEEYNDNF